jgi:hypothetical protein
LVIGVAEQEGEAEALLEGVTEALLEGVALLLLLAGKKGTARAEPTVVEMRVATVNFIVVAASKTVNS